MKGDDRYMLFLYSPILSELNSKCFVSYESVEIVYSLSKKKKKKRYTRFVDGSIQILQ